MCLGYPAVVLEVNYDEMTAVVDYGDGVPRKVLLGISTERVSRGDLVIVHAGVIVTKVGIEELLEQVEFFRETLGEDAEHLVKSYYYLIEKSKSIREV